MPSAPLLSEAAALDDLPGELDSNRRLALVAVTGLGVLGEGRRAPGGEEDPSLRRPLVDDELTHLVADMLLLPLELLLEDLTFLVIEVISCCFCFLSDDVLQFEVLLLFGEVLSKSLLLLAVLFCLFLHLSSLLTCRLLRAMSTSSRLAVMFLTSVRGVDNFLSTHGLRPLLPSPLMLLGAGGDLEQPCSCRI